jgi:predicted AAA+ superfamily ATPase
VAIDVLKALFSVKTELENQKSPSFVKNNCHHNAKNYIVLDEIQQVSAT